MGHTTHMDHQSARTSQAPPKRAFTGALAALYVSPLGRYSPEVTDVVRQWTVDDCESVLKNLESWNPWHLTPQEQDHRTHLTLAVIEVLGLFADLSEANVDRVGRRGLSSRGSVEDYALSVKAFNAKKKAIVEFLFKSPIVTVHCRVRGTIALTQALREAQNNLNKMGPSSSEEEGVEHPRPHDY